MHNFQELVVWKEAMEVAKMVYKYSRRFPSDERFGLTSQITRAAVSIPSNISEGAGRNTNKDFSHFLSISLGSSYELQTQWILAKELKYIGEIEFTEVTDKLIYVQKMIFKLQKKLTE